MGSRIWVAPNVFVFRHEDRLPVFFEDNAHNTSHMKEGTGSLQSWSWSTHHLQDTGRKKVTGREEKATTHDRPKPDRGTVFVWKSTSGVDFVLAQGNFATVRRKCWTMSRPLAGSALRRERSSLHPEWNSCPLYSRSRFGTAGTEPTAYGHGC